jgi:hypothetical protein
VRNFQLPVSDLRPPPAMHGECFMVVTKADIPCPEHHILLNLTPRGCGSGTLQGRFVLYRMVMLCSLPLTEALMVKQQRHRKRQEITGGDMEHFARPDHLQQSSFLRHLLCITRVGNHTASSPATYPPSYMIL